MRILIALLLISGLFLMCVFFENKKIIVRRYNISVDLPLDSDIRIVQISDIHKKNHSDNWRQLVSKVKNLEPDIIFITGDLASRTETSFEYKAILIEKLCKICPVYCSKGNHELDLASEVMEKYRDMLMKSGAVFLENARAEFIKGGTKLNIYGADLKKSIYKNEDGSYNALDTYTAEELEKIFGKPESISILLAHNPFFFSEYAKWGADIIFSGHVHGGVINTPFGGLLSPERKFFPRYTKGVYEIKSKKMIVSAGIGKLRLFNPPEILLLFLKKK